MTKYQPLWQQAGSYAASVDRGLLGSLWPAGGVTGAAVAAVANTMQVQAQPGTVAVPMQAGQGVELCRWDAAADSTVTLSAAPPSGQSRIDVYCVQVRDNAIDAGGNNDFIFIAVAGTPAASNPTTPATPANALALATIAVPGAAANLNSATITPRAATLWPGLASPGGRAYNPGTPYVGATTTIFTCASSVGVRGGCRFASGGIVVPQAGLYQVTVMLNTQGLVANTYMYPQIAQNGAAVSRGTCVGSTVAVNGPACAVSDVLLAAAGDLFQMAGFVQGSGPQLVGGTTELNFVSVAFVGP